MQEKGDVKSKGINDKIKKEREKTVVVHKGKSWNDGGKESKELDIR